MSAAVASPRPPGPGPLESVSGHGTRARTVALAAAPCLSSDHAAAFWCTCQGHDHVLQGSRLQQPTELATPSRQVHRCV